MNIEELSKILPKLEVESNVKYGFAQAYFMDDAERKIYLSNPLVDKERNLAAWLETKAGFTDEVQVKIYEIGEKRQAIASHEIFPLDGDYEIYYMKFYENALITIWKDQTYHILKIGLPNSNEEVNIKMLKLGAMINLDNKGIISHQEYDTPTEDKPIKRIKIPELITIETISQAEAKQAGLKLSDQWEPEA